MRSQDVELHCIHGGALYRFIGDGFIDIEAKHQVVPADVLDAWYPPSPRVLQKLRQHLDWGCRTSPPARGEGLKRAISIRFAVPENQIILGNGSSDLIFRLSPQIFKAAGPIVLPAPSYGEYTHVLGKIYNKSISLFSTYEDNLKIDVSRLLTHISKVEASGLILVNPCNPTGQCLSRDQLLQILRFVDNRFPVLIDETYFAYAPNQFSLHPEINNFKNLWIFRSLSKIYALSGLRVGYALAPGHEAELADMLTPTYTVPTLAQIAAIAALGDEVYVQSMIKETVKRREYLISQLSSIPTIKVLDTAINCVLIDLIESRLDASQLVNALAKNGVLVRDIASQGDREKSRYVRLAVLDYEANTRSCEALRQVLELA